MESYQKLSDANEQDMRLFAYVSSLIEDKREPGADHI